MRDRRTAATRAMCGFAPPLVPLLKENSRGRLLTIIPHDYSRQNPQKQRGFTSLLSFKINRIAKILPSRDLISSFFFFHATWDSLEIIVESKSRKLALMLRGGKRETRAGDLHLSVPAATIARGNQLLRGREYCRRGVLLAREGVRRALLSGRCPGSGVSPVSIVTILVLMRRVLPRCHNPADGLADKKCIAVCDRAEVFWIVLAALYERERRLVFSRFQQVARSMYELFIAESGSLNISISTGYFLLTDIVYKNEIKHFDQSLRF